MKTEQEIMGKIRDMIYEDDDDITVQEKMLSLIGEICITEAESLRLDTKIDEMTE